MRAWDAEEIMVYDFLALFRPLGCRGRGGVRCMKFGVGSLGACTSRAVVLSSEFLNVVLL